MKYSADFRLTSLDIAPNGGVRPGALLRYFQEAINLQMHDNPPSTEDLFARGQAFILSRTAMKLYSELEVYDNITVTTWANTSRGATYVRSAQIFRGNELCADIITLWALVDINNHRLIRVKDAVLGVGTLDELPDIPLPEKVRFPENTEMSPVGKRTVYYSDIDRNNHMNNTRYVDMICDFLPDVENSRIKAFTVSYNHECRLGEELSVYSIGEDGKMFFYAEKSDGTHAVDVEAELENI